jgi:hypothetical protein
MPQQPEDTRLRKAGRWSLYGAGGGAATYGLLAASRLRGAGWKTSLPVAGVAGAVGALRGGAAGGILGALTYRKKQQLQELSSMLDDLIEFQDPRPRNPLGEFSPQGEGGPNPNAMATVYKQPQEQPGVGTAKGAGLVLTGGALGGIGAAGGKDVYGHLKKLVSKLSSRKPPVK